MGRGQTSAIALQMRNMGGVESGSNNQGNWRGCRVRLEVRALSALLFTTEAIVYALPSIRKVREWMGPPKILLRLESKTLQTGKLT